jgi:hypothetical protein
MAKETISIEQALADLDKQAAAVIAMLQASKANDGLVVALADMRAAISRA